MDNSTHALLMKQWRVSHTTQFEGHIGEHTDFRFHPLLTTLVQLSLPSLGSPHRRQLAKVKSRRSLQELLQEGEYIARDTVHQEYRRLLFARPA